jgi:hypothetical protein
LSRTLSKGGCQRTDARFKGFKEIFSEEVWLFARDVSFSAQDSAASFSQVLFLINGLIDI